jgi:glutathione synthase/RimK-type ligase-like ATP-grasp enzyme
VAPVVISGDQPALEARGARPGTGTEYLDPTVLLPSLAVDLRIATCRPLPEPDPDEVLLLEALARAGVSARMAPWHDDDARWDEPIPTLIRSTWDYIHDVDGFLAWADRAAEAAPVWNGVDVIAGTIHKRYLLDLAAAGIPVAPTVLVERSATGDLGAIAAAQGWEDVVVKPAVGASSFATRRYGRDQMVDGQAHLEWVLERTDALVQPYLHSVDGSGERALIWIDGEFTHAVRKTPRFSDGDEHVSAAIAIGPDELALAERVLAPIAADLLYARVDVTRDDTGAPLVMELELIEPSLFLLQHPPALERLVGAVVRRLEATVARP